jgi:putative N6-adenine-specific DNA methylase
MSHITAERPLLACFAVTAPGLEPLVVEELRRLPVSPVPAIDPHEHGGVGFRTHSRGLYAANLHLRIATRVLVRVGSFHASGFPELERHARRLPWGEVVGKGEAVDFRVTSHKSRLYHQDAIAERLLATVESKVSGGGPTAARSNGPQEFVVRLVRDQCTISADASGALLHRRGYRLQTAKAPLRETLAAAMLVGAGWTGTSPLFDPMCGSGTIPIEAALMARQIPPGLGRSFAFEEWPAFDAETWGEVLAAARERILTAAGVRLVGSDRDAGAIEAAIGNAKRAGVADDVEWRRAAISAIEAAPTRGWIVTNPPYGRRVGDRKRLRNLYAQMGNVLRAKCSGWELAMLSAHPELDQQTRLALDTRLSTENGGLRVRLMCGRVP